jgi:hypothetical protein
MLSNAKIQNLLTYLEVTTTLFDTRFPTPTLLHLMTWWGEWDVQQRVMMRNKETLAREKGEFCVFDKMQVVVERGWKHV